MEATYTTHGDYNLPDLTLPPQSPQALGKYGQLRARFLRQSRRALYLNLLTTGRLQSHLREIEQAARNRLEQIMTQLMEAEGLTEERKARDQMAWVGRMNNLRQRADELILSELIYS